MTLMRLGTVLGLGLALAGCAQMSTEEAALGRCAFDPLSCIDLPPVQMAALPPGPGAADTADTAIAAAADDDWALPDAASAYAADEPATPAPLDLMATGVQ